MPTTLYFAENTASRKESGTYPVAATNYAAVTPTRALTTEGFMIPYPWRGVVNLTQSSSNVTSAQTAKFGRFYSPPFATDYVYSHPTNSTDAIKFYMADYESNLSANHCIQQCFIFVWRPSTGAVVGVIKPVATLAIGSKEPSAINSIQSTLGEYFQAAGTINILAGDILVFEPWSTFTQGAATAYTIRFYYGGTTEITAENTVIAAPASKVVFSVDLPLAASGAAVRGAVKYKAVNELRGAKFVSSLKSKARLMPVTLVPGSPFISKNNKAKATITANLTTQVLMQAHLKSSSKLARAWVQQEHNLSMTLRSVARAYATFPDKSVGESLNIYYSGIGSAENPALSIGGKKGAAVGGNAFTVSATVPGFEVLSVHGMAPGDYKVKIDSARRLVSLVLVDELQGFPVGIDDGVTVVALGSKEAGFITVKLDRDSITTATVTVTTEARENTMFLNPSPTAIANGETVYRCLYLFNDTDQEVLNVVLTVSDVSLDTVTIGSEFSSDVSLQGHNNALTMRSRATDPTGWGGMFFLGDNMQFAAEVSANGLPLLISSAAGREQSSDGDTIQVPQTLTTDKDPEGRLSSLVFDSSLTWTRIPPHRGVTFWVRKVMPPGAVEGINTSTFTVTADF